MNKKKYEIKHHKDFHKVQLQGLKVKERSIFMALCYKAMNQENNLLEFDVDEIAKISGYTQQTGDNIYQYLRKTYRSLKDITIEIDKSNGFHDFVLFVGIQSFEDTGKIHFKVNEDYRYLLNQVVKPFTIQDMLEYRQLDSGYSQLMYSILKEWEGAKSIKLAIDDFRRKLGIPPNYQMCDINKRILKTIMEELSPYFPNLKIEKFKNGRSISHIKFSWSEKKSIPKKEQLELPQARPSAQPVEEVKSPVMAEVRQCIAKHSKCPGHRIEAINTMCLNMRQYTGKK